MLFLFFVTSNATQVIATARTSDLVLLLIDIAKADHHRPILENELEAVGIRLNKPPPGIYYKKKAHGSSNSIAFTATCKLTYLSEKLCKDILHDYKIHNAELIIREDCTVDEFIDVIEGNRAYLPCIYCYSKVDLSTIEEVDRVARLPFSMVISCHWDLNLDGLLERIWEMLRLVRIYTKKKVRRGESGRGDTLGALHNGNDADLDVSNTVGLRFILPFFFFF